MRAYHVRRRFVSGLVMLLVAVVSSGAAAEVVQNISTGVDPETGAKIPNNTEQSTYVIAPGGTGGEVGQRIIAWSEGIDPYGYPFTYAPDDASDASRWISIYPPEKDNPIVGLGTFHYQTTVDLSGYDPATAVIAAPRFAVDDTFNGVLVNGVNVFTPPPPGYFSNMDHLRELSDLGAGAFRPGLNTITFVIENVADQSPASLRLEANVTATPIPESAAAAAVGALGFLLLRRKPGRGE
jgi:hypothetical protein